MLAGIAQQQRSGVDELGGRRLSAVRECFQPAAFFFGKGNLISGCHARTVRKLAFAVDSRESGCIVHGFCPQPRQKPWPNSTQDPIIGQ
jgi:hypothetical protein